MGGSGWLSKGSELSWISNYCISLIKIRSKMKTVENKQTIVYGRTDARTHTRTTDTASRHKLSGLWPVELKMKIGVQMFLDNF